MKLVYIILCRLSSKRLPGKMLRELHGKPLLWYSYEALRQFTAPENIVVATSEEVSDHPIANYCETLGVRCFRGSLENVAERFMGAMNLLQVDYAVRVCGDNVFVSHSILQRIKSALEAQKPDFLSNTPGRTFPYGMSFEAVKPAVYNEHYPKFESDHDREHVMPYFYRQQAGLKTTFLTNEEYPSSAGLKLAVDTLEDFNRVEAMLVKSDRPFYQLSLDEITALYHQTHV